MRQKPRPNTYTPPVAERIRGALFGLCLGDSMGMAMVGRHFQLPEFPVLYAPPEEALPPPPLPLKNSFALAFAACAAYCLLNTRQFHLGSLLNAYRRHAALLQNMGKLAPLAPYAPHARPLLPEEMAPPQGSAAPPPLSLEPGLAWALTHFLRLHSPSALLKQSVRTPPPPPVLDSVLLRSLPLACFFYANTPTRIRAVTEEALATRTGPLGALAAVAFSSLVAHSILSPKPHAAREELLEAMHRDMADAAPALAHIGIHPVSSIHEALSQLREDFLLAQEETPGLYGPMLSLRKHGGQLRVSFRLALWELFRAEVSPGGAAGAVEDVIRRGGSPASQGALLAALCGARWGRESLPSPTPLGVAGLPPKKPNSPGDVSFLKALAEAMASNL